MKKTCLILLILVFISLGCSKDKVKPSADSIMTQNALRSLDIIKDAYQTKNKTVILQKVDSALSESILKELFFEKAELSFTPRMVRISAASKINVHLNWHGTWVVEGRILKNRGVGILTFEGETPKLTQINKDNPFLTPEIKE